MARTIVSFSKLKQSFYGRVSDLHIFDCSKYNLLKVVLDGIKVDYAGRGKVRVILFSPGIFIRFFLWLERLRRKNQVDTFRKLIASASTKNNRKFLFVEPSGRVYSEAGKDYSLYMTRLVELYGRNSVWFVSEGDKKKQWDVDAVLPAYSLTMLATIGMSSDFVFIRNELHKTFSNILAAGIFTDRELENIRIALQQFAIQYVVWKEMLKGAQVKSCYLWPHYHREGCIMALKEEGIVVNELQHGLIVVEDLFYGFPERISKMKKDMLFADRIYVYGDYWKSQVVKGNAYAPDKVVVGGYFPYAPLITPDVTAKYTSLFPEHKIILVTTQTFLDAFFVNHIKYLSADLIRRNERYAILVKLHPAEKAHLYSELDNLHNVKIVNDSIDVLMSAADLHVSVYSTTMFEALKSNVPNFSVYHPDLAEYIEIFRLEGVSVVIQPDQNPIDHQQQSHNRKSVEWYYSPFNSVAFQ